MLVMLGSWFTDWIRIYAVFGAFVMGVAMPRGKLHKKVLRVCRVVDAPVHELSGICLRRSQSGRLSLVAVGDRMAKIAWFAEPRRDDGRIKWQTRSIAKLSGSNLPKRDPQIEAVCADEAIDAADALAIAVCVAGQMGRPEAAGAVLDRGASAPIERGGSGYERAVREALAREKRSVAR